MAAPRQGLPVRLDRAPQRAVGEEVRRRSGTFVSWPRPDEAVAARDRASQARGHQAEGRDILKNARRLLSACGHRNVLRYVLSASRGAAVGFLVASTP